MEVEINNKKYEVEIIKKNNRNTYVRVKNGKIIVTTNYLTSKNSILNLIMDNKRGIIDMIEKDAKKVEKNDNFYLWGTKIDVVYGFSDISVIGTRIYAKDEKHLEKFVATKMMELVEDRVLYWYATFDECIPLPSLKIRKMTSRWGVCNTKTKTITLNYYLSRYDICCLDYVIVHELSHFIHPNHSSKFWDLVGKYYPMYKECRKMLKE